MEEPITFNEISRVVPKLAKVKETGPDEIRAEFYQCDPDMWANILCPVFENIITRQHQTPKSFRNPILVLLHQGRGTKYTANFRPIALVNVLIKFLTKAYAKRVRNVISQLALTVKQDSNQEHTLLKTLYLFKMDCTGREGTHLKLSSCVSNLKRHTIMSTECTFKKGSAK